MATNNFIIDSLAQPNLDCVQTALNGMTAMENLLCEMCNVALLAQSADNGCERRDLALRFDSLRRDLDVIAAGTLGIGAACGEAQIFPQDYQASSATVLRVCDADGAGLWMRVAGLPPHSRFPAGEHQPGIVDASGVLHLNTIAETNRLIALKDGIYNLLNGYRLSVRLPIGIVQMIDQHSHPDLRLYLDGPCNGWNEPFGHAMAIARSLAQTDAALQALQSTTTSFGAYIYRLYQRYGFGGVPANDI